MLEGVVQQNAFLRSAGRPEGMGHNTCKSMGGILCVVRRSPIIKMAATWQLNIFLSIKLIC